MVGHDYGVTKTVVDGQVLPSLPGILRETFPHIATEDGVGAVADFGVGVKEPESGIGYSDSRASSAIIREQELAVLVVGTGRARLNIDLVVVVLA